MPDTPKSCQFGFDWVPEFKYLGCAHPVERDNRCIFHMKKPTEEEKSEMALDKRAEAEEIEKKFRQKLSEFLRKMERKPASTLCNFQGFIFPSIFFEDTIFSKRADFSGAIFTQETKFKKVIFKQEVIFYRTNFNQQTDFERTTFSQKADFQWATFSENVYFRQATFSKEAIFTSDSSRRCFNGECDFTHLTLPKDAEVIFEEVNLDKARFVDTNLSRITFRNVQWSLSDRRLKILASRTKLWDELRLLSDVVKESDYKKVAENYHYLVSNYEKQGDYDTAEKFRISEMEMRRKKNGAGVKSGWLRIGREWVNPYGLYKVSSNYSAGYWQALSVLLGMLLFFSLMFLYTGFQQNKESASQPVRVIEYDLWPDPSHYPVGTSQWLSDYGAALSLSSSVIAFRQHKYYDPVEGSSRFWLYLAVFVLNAQTTAVIFAIVRRFRP